MNSKTHMTIQENIIRLTNEYILTKRICSLPITTDQIKGFINENRYEICSYQEGLEIIEKFKLQSNMQYPAFTFANDQFKIVFYHDDLSVSEKNIYLAHELGHIVLNHIYWGTKDKSGNIFEKQELEADTFAYQLISPICILKALKINTIDKIEKKTLLSCEQAQIAFERMAIVSDTCDRMKLIKQFIKPIIHKYKSIIITVTISVVLLLIISLSFVFWDKDNTNKQDNFPNQEIESYSNTNSETAEQDVYITKTGKRYHKKSCKYVTNEDGTLKDGVLLVSIFDCIEAGYTGCAYCFNED